MRILGLQEWLLTGECAREGVSPRALAYCFIISDILALFYTDHSLETWSKLQVTPIQTLTCHSKWHFPKLQYPTAAQ